MSAFCVFFQISVHVPIKQNLQHGIPERYSRTFDVISEVYCVLQWRRRIFENSAQFVQARYIRTFLCKSHGTKMGVLTNYCQLALPFGKSPEKVHFYTHLKLPNFF